MALRTAHLETTFPTGQTKTSRKSGEAVLVGPVADASDETRAVSGRVVYTEPLPAPSTRHVFRAFS